jgi:hypothetical protein
LEEKGPVNETLSRLTRFGFGFRVAGLLVFGKRVFMGKAVCRGSATHQSKSGLSAA